MKKIQYIDTKFRLIQTINQILINTGTHVNITYFITSYTGLFLNLIICSINHHTVYLSYTLRIKNYNYIETNDKYNMNITHVNCPIKFDQGSIPELDYVIYNN